MITRSKVAMMHVRTTRVKWYKLIGGDVRERGHRYDLFTPRSSLFWDVTWPRLFTDVSGNLLVPSSRVKESKKKNAIEVINLNEDADSRNIKIQIHCICVLLNVLRIYISRVDMFTLSGKWPERPKST